MLMFIVYVLSYVRGAIWHCGPATVALWTCHCGTSTCHSGTVDTATVALWDGVSRHSLTSLFGEDPCLYEFICRTSYGSLS